MTTIYMDQVHISLSRFVLELPMGGSAVDGVGCWTQSENAEIFLSQWEGIQTQVTHAMIGNTIPFCFKCSYLDPDSKVCFRSVEIRCLMKGTLTLLWRGGAARWGERKPAFLGRREAGLPSQLEGTS